MTSMDQWSTVLYVAPKFKAMKLSYLEMTTKAEKSCQ